MLAAVLLALCTLTDPNRGGEATDNWAQWRGPLGTGVAPDARPPLEWSETKNVRWKTALPGKGHSSPVVWGDRIFLTTAIPSGDPTKPRFVRPGAHDNADTTRAHEFVVLCVDRTTGKILWQKTVNKAVPHEGGHLTASFASASPVTDGRHVFASFGSHGLYCLDAAGTLVWEKDLGEMHSKHGHGEGSSPALHGDTLVVNWDHEGESFLVALDKGTGTERWRVPRPEDTS
jgi:outer membrane protein assembly factor BamB